MSLTGESILIVIPTRNRSDLAPTAIRSVLDQSPPNVRVMVSDNSNKAAEVDRLKEFCEKLGHERLTYVRPPEPLAMTQHWEWALQEALSDRSVTHVAYLTDRMVFKAGALAELQRLVARYPDKVISYINDVVIDYRSPVRLDQLSWTGRLFELKTADMLAECARASSWIFFSCLPRMLNCVVPREVFSQIAAKFGNVFLSTSPDVCFAFRCLERLDSILYYDKTFFVAYAHARSAGTAYVRGIMNSDSADFTAQLKGKQRNYAAPIPEFATSTNAVMQEYCFVKAESQSSKFPEVDMKNYLDSIAGEIVSIEDPVLKREMELLIERHRPQPGNGDESVSARDDETARRVSRFSLTRLSSVEGRRALWRSLNRRFEVATPASNQEIPEFETAEEALSYSARHPRPRSLGSAIVENRMPARDLPQDW